jgi:hypothetical protein
VPEILNDGVVSLRIIAARLFLTVFYSAASTVEILSEN